MSRRKRQDLGPDLPFDTEAAEQIKQLEAGLHVSTGPHERLPDELDQALQRTRRRVEAPRAHIPLLQHHRAARPEESEVVGDLVWSTTQRCDLEPSVDEVERRRLQLAREEVVLHEHDVAEALRVDELSGGGEHRVVDIGPHHLAVGPDPLAQQSEPPDRTAPDVEHAVAATFADLLEKPPPARLAHPRLELQPLQLGGLIRQQIRLGRHLHAPLENALKDAEVNPSSRTETSCTG